MARQRLLLLTGTPPGVAHVGEIILRDLVRYYGSGRAHCLAVTSPRYRWSPDPELADLSMHHLTSQHVHAQRSGGKLGALAAHLRYLTGFDPEVSRLVAQAVELARKAGVEQIFAVLNNPLLMTVARRVAGALGLPLKTLVWDPPEYLLQQARFDRWSRVSLLQEFRRTLAASTRVAVVSETMQQDYAQWTQAPVQLLRHGVAADVAAGLASVAQPPEDEWVIGFAGSMYSVSAWRAFLKALDHVDWRLAGRPIRLRLMTDRIEVASRCAARIDYLGFRSPEQVQAQLATCHLCYMPQPFEAHLLDLCRYSFPTKLGNYLALGRPVFVHCPPKGALSAFVAEHRIGTHADALDADTIITSLERLLGDDRAYRDACGQARLVADQYLSVSAFHAAIDEFLVASAGAAGDFRA